MKDTKGMTREELSAYLMGVAVALRYEGKSAYVAEQIEEAATRLRDSIDRPKVEVVHDQVGQVWRLLVNGTVIIGSGYTQGDLYARTAIEGQSHTILAALGMEGGEG